MDWFLYDIGLRRERVKALDFHFLSMLRMLCYVFEDTQATTSIKHVDTS